MISAGDEPFAVFSHFTFDIEVEERCTTKIVVIVFWCKHWSFSTIGGLIKTYPKFGYIRRSDV